MNKDTVKKLFAKLEKDAELQKRFTAIMQAHHSGPESALAARLVEFGGAEGFSFTGDDLLAARRELADKMNSNAELSDTELGAVAGGEKVGAGGKPADPKFAAIAVSVSTVGVMCVVSSIVVEVQVSGSCLNGLTIKGSHCPNK